MKNQDLFSSKVKSKKLECRLLQVLFGALRINRYVKSCNAEWQTVIKLLLYVLHLPSNLYCIVIKVVEFLKMLEHLNQLSVQ